MRAGAFVLCGRRQSRLVGARIGEHDFQICAALQIFTGSGEVFFSGSVTGLLRGWCNKLCRAQIHAFGLLTTI
jgi:hypothetical protein